MLWLIIEEKLTEKNMSIYRLSKLSGVSTQSLSAIKLGQSKKPSFEIVVKIAEVLDIDLNQFKKKGK
ncbi:helix-turn-helix domain-containing protein [Lactococcus taiwanensis]|uniref:helix-turn-helix domain-containing protein n=1 Tax=Lactococcus taiwanensis TaxID=1151742 RepID=UPI00196322BF|nr:helix-turn-helix transcriptional regulator [Lactococcus taiwanensis]QRZ11427.1 helix-turn-helix transcriptional regulator [Lactococcus taiwanensis]